MFSGFYNSPIGIMKITANDDCILSISIHESLEEENLNRIINLCKKELDEYFKHERKMFNLPLQFIGTEFQKEVWTYLVDIPFGETVSYKDVAIGIGREKAVRAVANAIGDNELLIVVPCHRVIGSNGKLTGFSCGIEKKEYLLTLEGSKYE